MEQVAEFERSILATLLAQLPDVVKAILTAVWPLLLAAFIAFVISRVFEHRAFNRSSYGRLTGNSYTKIRQDNGLSGEYRLCREIERFAEDPHILMNVYVPRKDGTTSECDLLLVGRSGVWVFENKNYSGWIFGNGKQKMWTQSLNKATKVRFYNPVWQNMGHVRTLSAYLGLPEECFVPIVVFNDKCELKKVSECACPVIKTRDVYATAKRLVGERGVVITEEQQRDIIAKLEPLAHASDATKAEHVEQARAARSHVKRG